MNQSDLNKAEVIFVNHSGGKDSQAMLAKLIRMGLKGKLVLIHADLGEMEWEPMHGWIESISFGLPVNVVRADVDFFDLCYKYKRIPDGRARFCTNALKTVPCERFMREYCKTHNITNAISALGIRAEESPNRAKMQVIREKTRLLTIWNPIFDWTIDQVKTEIANANQKLHWVYDQGYSRLSCVLCPLGRIGEHKMMANDRPELFKKMAKLERDLGKTIRMKQIKGVKYNKYLDEYAGVNA